MNRCRICLIAALLQLALRSAACAEVDDPSAQVSVAMQQAFADYFASVTKGGAAAGLDVDDPDKAFNPFRDIVNGIPAAIVVPARQQPDDAGQGAAAALTAPARLFSTRPCR